MGDGRTILPERDVWTYSQFREWVKKEQPHPGKMLEVTPAQMMDMAEWPREFIRYAPTSGQMWVGPYTLWVRGKEMPNG